MVGLVCEYINWMWEIKNLVWKCSKDIQYTMDQSLKR